MVGISSNCLLVADGLVVDGLKTGDNCIGCKLEFCEVDVVNHEVSKSLMSVVLDDGLFINAQINFLVKVVELLRWMNLLR